MADTRCPSVHYVSQSCCQLNAGHDGPHVAESGYMNTYYCWEHDTREPNCNQRNVPFPTHQERDDEQ